MNFKILLLLFITSFVMKSMYSQHVCGTHSPTLANKQYLKTNIYTQIKPKNTGTTCVALKAFVVRQDNGNGGVNVQQLNEIISFLNYSFLDAGIEFYWIDFPSYLNNSDLYEFNSSAPDNDNDFQLTNSFPQVSNAINVFFVNNISVAQGVAGGYAYLPYGDDADWNKIVLAKSSLDTDEEGKVVKHEMGHYFALLHTFEGTIYGPNDSEAENVSRFGANSNCYNSGDYLCDTPADPGYTPNTFNELSCEYTGTGTDRFGDLYAPDEDNIMSYFPYYCAKTFTQEQNDLIGLGLNERMSYTSYSINGQAANVNAPSNLTASLQAGQVVLNWQDNANNEMGYIVEISENSNNSGFVSLQKNATIENVTNLTINAYHFDLNTTYYFRIKASNASCNNYSNVAQLTITDCIPVTNSCASIISRFVLNDINNSSNLATCNQNNAYSNYDSISTEVLMGQTYPFQISLANNPTFLDTIAIWVDWNEDGDFEDTNEFIYKNFSQTFYSDSITIPQNISFGDKTLRLRVSFYEAMYPCGVDDEGEIEDYTLKVADPNACKINSLTLGNQLQCNLLNNTYSQEIFIDYQNPPSSGFLNVNNLDYDISGSPQKIIIENLDANNNFYNVNTFFTAETTCKLDSFNFIESIANCALGANERTLYIESFPSDLGSVIINNNDVGPTPFLGAYTLSSNLTIQVIPDTPNVLNRYTKLSTGQSYYVSPINLVFQDTDTIYVYYNQDVGVKDFESSFNSFNIYPTVFNNQINIAFETKESANISIDMYGIDGKLVKNLFHQQINSNVNYKEKFNVNVSSGMYFIKVSSKNSSFSQKIIKY